MSPVPESPNGQGHGQPLRLVFDEGPLIVEGLRENDEHGLPGVQYDFRTRQFRAQAIWYRTIVETLRKQKRDYLDAARGYEPSPWRLQVAKEAFPHQVEGLKAWWDEGRGGPGVALLPTPTRQTPLAPLAITPP